MVDSQAKGKRAERALVLWLKEHGWPDARRFVQTGNGRDADQGDIRLEGARGAGTVVVEVKHYAGGLTDGMVQQFLTKLAGTQLRRGELGLLVERRNGHADPGGWWCWLDVRTLTALLAGRTVQDPAVLRLTVADAFRFVRIYQSRLNNPFSAGPATDLVDVTSDYYATPVRRITQVTGLVDPDARPIVPGGDPVQGLW